MTMEGEPGLAALCVDVAGSHQLIDRLGRARFDRLMRGVRAVCRTEIEAQRGGVLGFDGDAGYAAFDSPASALHVATAIRGRLATDLEEPIAVRIGLDLVRASDLRAGSARRAAIDLGIRTLVGQFAPVQSFTGTRILRLEVLMTALGGAVRLCAAAEPGTIVISAPLADAVASDGAANDVGESIVILPARRLT